MDSVDYNAHEVIGQEFDNVLVIVGEMFNYNNQNQLISTSKSYYHSEGMLLQILTRARKKICLVIVNNEPILRAVLDILK